MAGTKLFSGSSYGRIFSVVVGVAWAAAVGLGLSRLWTYKGTAGLPARPPPTWPAATSVVRTAGLATLVLVLHPQCPCSRATVGELARLMATCDGKLTATVLMLRPEGAPAGWERTDLWRSAAAIPNVLVMADEAGTERRRYGAATSGQTFLYAPDGRLLFAGGITASRGHSGDNAGRSAIVSLVRAPSDGPRSQPIRTPVYGCPLLGPSVKCDQPECEECDK